jgi:hypothetical protein
VGGAGIAGLNIREKEKANENKCSGAEEKNRF